MKNKEIPDLVVLDKEGQVLGVISDHDIAIGCVATGKPPTTKVAESMYIIEPVGLNTPVEVAFKRMQALKVTVVPVVENGKLQGVVTITDCWGYLPEKYEDNKGFISVKNPKFANYWFSVFFTLLYLIFGFIFPMIGITGFLQSKITVSANYNPSVTYFLFDAHGGNYFLRYLDAQSDSIVWTMITFYSFIFVIVGLLTSLLVIQWAYADYSMTKTSHNWHIKAFIFACFNMIIIWTLFFYLYFDGIVRVGVTNFDIAGLLFSILSIICLGLALARDLFFKRSSPVTQEVSA